MPNTFTAPFTQSPKTATAVVTGVATVNNDTPANTILLMTAGADGCLVTFLSAIPRATVTASSLVLFLSKDNGTTQRLIDSELMAAYTMATTTAVPETMFANITEANPLRLQAGDRLYVGSQVALAGGIVFFAEFSDF